MKVNDHSSASVIIITTSHPHQFLSIMRRRARKNVKNLFDIIDTYDDQSNSTNMTLSKSGEKMGFFFFVLFFGVFFFLDRRYLGSWGSLQKLANRRLNAFNDI